MNTALFAPLTALLITLAAASSHAEGLEASAGAGLRSLPFGVAASGTVGYGHLLWGDNGPNQYFYGFVRPSVRLQSSALVNLFDLRVDFFPVSFFGLTAGHAESLRVYDAGKVDCDTVTCQGAVRRNYLRAALVLGYADYFVVGTARLDLLDPTREGRRFYDEQASLIGGLNGDHLVAWELYFGKKFLERHTAGLWFVNTHMNDSGQQSDLESAYYKFDHVDWNLTGGVGAYRSSLQSRGLTAFVSFQYVFLPAMGLL